ncbi:MAG: radical SAM protein [Deltaproteobacteria bacterium]
MAKVLLINPSYKSCYGNGKASIMNPIFPTLGLMTIAAMVLKRGHKVEVLDLSYERYHYDFVKKKIEQYKPDIVGIGATTPFMNQARDISVLVKSIWPEIVTVVGGPHASALPYESLKESMFDIAVVGEGDYTFSEIVDGRSFETINGIYYRRGGHILNTPPRNFVQNLDELPMPALELYDASFYKNKVSHLWTRRTPCTVLEFSRGCVYKCNFCASKNTMALGYRKKSPERCAEEVKYLSRCGYKEFVLVDDIFTSDNKWALAVSEALIKANTDVLWTCTNGIRVESADDRLFKVMRKAGCYRVAFGFESGNDEVLKKFGKGGQATIEQGFQAVKLARKSKIDTSGYFMLGLSHDTEETMTDTIRYAKALELDMLKFGKTIAFPGTSMFNEYSKIGLIKSYNWDDYFIYSSETLFTHPKLSHDVIKKYMKIANLETVIKNPNFIVRRVIRGIRTGEFFWDFYYFIKWLLASSLSTKDNENIYYSKDKWPSYNFKNNGISNIPVRTAANKIAVGM